MQELIKEAVKLHEELFPKEVGPAERFARLREHLQSVWKTVSVDEERVVAEIEDRWGAIADAVFREHGRYDELLSRLDRMREPGLQEVGLLDLLRRARRETLHTRAIGAFIDPTRSGALGGQLLESLLNVVLGRAGRVCPPSAQVAQASVTIEPMYVVPGRRGRGNTARYPTPDLRIEVPSVTPGVGSLIAIIENKIDDQDREGQLSIYAQCTTAQHGDPVLVYLTPSGAPPTQADAGEWTRLSYLDVAVAWRAVLQAQDAKGVSGPWVEALRAYLSTITREVCSLRLVSPRGRADKSTIVPYLRAAVGDG